MTATSHASVPAAPNVPAQRVQPVAVLWRHTRGLAVVGTVSLIALVLLLVYLAPFGYMVATSLKNNRQVTEGRPLPQTPATFTYEGRNYDVYRVPTDDGPHEWALIGPGRTSSTFVDPDNPEAGLVTWEGRWRGLEPVLRLDPQWTNFSEAYTRTAFPRLMRNTMVVALVGAFGTLVSCILVAYGFARFPIPGKGWLFALLISTIILPKQVTLVPTYAFFAAIGWTNTWLPLIVPHFFANAYNVFLLRQYFLTLPRELDEAAMMDGAGPGRILWSVIIPQSWPVIVAVGLFHIVFAWNDYFEPLIYLLGAPNLQPISVGIQQFNYVYARQPAMLQATALMALVPPIVLFFVAQGVFMRGVVVTGVEK